MLRKVAKPVVAKPAVKQKVFLRRLSPAQFAFMRAIAEGEAKGSKILELVNYTTFGSLVTRKYVTLDSKGNLAFTELGWVAFQTYVELEMPMRSHPGEMTAFVSKMLGMNSQQQVRKAGAA